jgi:hypothetical protein
MSDNGPDLSFDKASYASPSGGVGGGEGASIPCNQCKRPLGQQYWKLQKFLLCDGCKQGVSASLAQSQSASSFAKALVQGGLVALACGVAYAVFVAVTKIQLALVTIGIAFLIAKVVRKASSGLSGRKFQVLAVVLTYVASTMGYAPGILAAVSDSADKHHAASPAAGAPAAAPGAPASTAPASDGSGAAQGSGEAGKPVGAMELVLAFAMLVGIMLAAPFLEITEAPIGVLIVLFGLWEAWKLSRGVNLVIEGPFRVAPATPGAPAG